MDDKTLRDDVIEALDFDPSVNAADIGVAVKEGVVTLSGHVGSFAEKMAAEQCVKRVRGVKAIAEELTVRYASDKKTADDEIAHRAVSILTWHWEIPKDAIKVKVERGVVTLSGQVPWHFQRIAAETAVRKLTGVISVCNAVTIMPRTSEADVKEKIMAAFRRDADLESQGIRVMVNDDKVRLEGVVKAWRERNIAEQAAWSAPGVRIVEDNLKLA